MFLAFVALICLRLVIGFHFFKEGTNKLKSGDFTAEYFLAGAKGPLAPYFQSLIRDYDGRERLCIEEVDVDGETRLDFNTDLTFALWDDFLDQATDYYGFGSEQLQAEIQRRRDNLAEEIQQARDNTSTSISTRELEEIRNQGERSILKIRTQPEDAEEILKNHKDQLLAWLSGNRTEVISHFGTADRLEGFERDGVNRQTAATYVESLRYQVDEIRQDRNKQLANWSGEIKSVWDSFESQINALATDKQAERPPLPLHRPFAQKNSNLNLINQVIPWFDTIVGVLLILGLFTRLASLAGAGFLASVIATQPPWVPGTTPTYYQAIELFALLVIFATCAGRIGGLDYFFSRHKQQQNIDNSQ